MDPYFKPELSSLYDEYDTLKMRDSYTAVVWKRASEIYGSTVRIFGDEPPQADDINHGALEKAYFLTVLSAMAAQPGNLIEGLFETKEVNAAGIYMIYLYVNGVRTPIIIDDLIPVWSSTNQPVFATSKD